MYQFLYTTAERMLSEPIYLFMFIIIFVIILLLPNIRRSNKRKQLDEFQTRGKNTFIVLCMDYLESKGMEEPDLIDAYKMLREVLNTFTMDDILTIVSDIPELNEVETYKNRDEVLLGQKVLKHICTIFERPKNGSSGFFHIHPKRRDIYIRVSGYVEES